jgi:hypothetical protein
MVRYSNVIWIPDKLVRFSNGQLALPMYCGLKTGSVFKWFKQDGRFYHLNTGLSSFKMLTVVIIKLCTNCNYLDLIHVAKLEIQPHFCRTRFLNDLSFNSKLFSKPMLQKYSGEHTWRALATILKANMIILCLTLVPHIKILV